jgi:uncharacterized OB-fold protein
MACAPAKPFPQPDSASAPFFEALRRRQLLVQRCTHCGLHALGSHRCRNCRHALRWEPAYGRGTVYSLTRIHLAYHPAFERQVPYDVVLATLAEGPHLFGGFRDEGGRAAQIGMPLIVEFEPAGDTWLPFFVPATVPIHSHITNNQETP